ncbi:Nitrogenase molybdenum-iron protein, alpha and beta chains [Lachnospiraceae bacterium NE2001]|nr:Nitrogenase molybdenum-iron protein, alpha and beta chains [Lachnospiraceae bacterium NE2001]
MNQTARRISIYAADTSGFCSALYEYGGMTVIHDASGCNSTYTTHDEPRWYDKDSMMYISGFTEKDAIMGNDERFVHDLVLAAEELKPNFVAICASPLPAMTGVDLEAIAYEVESETGIPSFNVKTNGMQSYITGAGNAYLELAKHFTKPADKAHAGLVNVLGLTPLDFPLEGTVQDIRKWLAEHEFQINATVGIDSSLEQIQHLSEADASLVVASTGIPLAEYLFETYGIPYVVGAPLGGEEATSVLCINLKIAVKEGARFKGVKMMVPCGKRIAVIGESILSRSLANAIYAEYKVPARVLESVGDGYMEVLISGKNSNPEIHNENEMQLYNDALDDVSCDDEDILEQEISKSDIIIGDPLFEPLCSGKTFIRLPHMAFSGRCFLKEEVQLIGRPLSETSLGRALAEALK